MEDLVDKCLEIECKLLDIKIGFGDSLEKGKIPWQICPNAFSFTPQQIEEIEDIGSWAFNFFKASVELYKNKPGIRNLLDMGKGKLVLNFQKLVLDSGKMPRFFRADLLLMENGKFQVGEFSLKPGGTGITAGLQEVYSGNMIGQGILQCYGRLLDEGNGKGLFAVATEKYRTFTEFQGLTYLLNKKGYDCHFNDPCISAIPKNGLLYSYLPPRTWIDYQEFISRAWQDCSVFTPPPYIFLKEKALFALLRDRNYRSFWKNRLGRGYNFLQEKLVDSALITNSNHCRLLNQNIKLEDLKKLTNRPRRNFLIKLSGFSEGSSGAKGVVLGMDVGSKTWNKSITDAQNFFIKKRGLYILQPFIPSVRVPIKFLDWDLGNIREEKRYLRILAYYFVFNEEVVLAGIEVNSRKRAKVHLQKDATSVPGVLRAQ